MRLFDRKNKMIGQARWRKLFADPAYRTVKTTDHGGLFRVETTWVGIAMDGETEPKLFLTEVQEYRDGGYRPCRQRLDPIWSTTEAEALRLHEGLAVEYGGAA